MTDQALRRTDELLSELVELVETARTLPMSSSCVLPRERVLDLLDELRETMPPEMDEARRVLNNRDTLLHDAFTEATEARERASAEADAIVADATNRAEQVRADADQHVQDVVAAARAKHDELVSATGVHQAAQEAAIAIRDEADRYRDETIDEAQRLAEQTRGEAARAAHTASIEAERYAAKLVADAERYADSTLADLADTLTRAAHTADQGRSALAQRRARAESNPYDEADAETETISQTLSA
jgi:cell division septum initiation protein DivIVA